MKISIFLLFLAAFCFNCTRADATGSHPSKRALLIGINNYANVRQLKGCVNDVTAMKTLLTSNYQFPEKNITMLTDQMASREKILAAFQQLIEATDTNDIVLIHYSGHGSQIYDKTGNEVDSLDETIIPCDYDYKGVYPISDKQLAVVLAALARKTRYVTIILDCCHSGGGTKDLDIDRSARMILADKREMPAKDAFREISTGQPQKSGHLKNGTPGYVLFAGCQSDQQSYEITINPNTSHGAMTWFLIKELRSARETLTWEQVREDVNQQIRKYYPDQNPQLEGSMKDSYVFGEPYVLKKEYITLRMASGKIKLDGGAIFGLTAGSVFSVYPPGEIRFTGIAPAKVKITRVDPTHAGASLVSGTIPPGVCRAIETEHIYSQETLGLRFTGNWDGRATVVRKTLLSLPGVSEEKNAPDMTLASDGTSILLYFGHDSSAIIRRYSVIDDKTPTLVRQELKGWLKWFNTLKINNTVSPLVFVLTINKGSKGLDLNKIDYTCMDQDDLILTVTNKTSDPVFFTLVDMRDNGTVEVYPLSSLVDPQKNSNEPLAGQASIDIPIHMSVREGCSKNRDIIKLFAASDANMRFDFLKQGIISYDGAKTLSDTPSDGREITPAYPPLRDLAKWGCVEKLVLIKK
jgi:hypothetical protein